MKILITGAHGQLGRALSQCLTQEQTQVVALGRDTLDLRDTKRIPQTIEHCRPDLVINAAAYTAVDRAEQEPEHALAVNATAPRILAETCARRRIPLIHYSTDYVFDGQLPRTHAYTEQDTPNPLNQYGHTKWAGEQAIQGVGGDFLILRTSWVYSLQGHNFLRTVLRLLSDAKPLRVVDDQWGAPTWTGTLAEVTAQLIQSRQQGQPVRGLYHATARGATSWYGFACAIRDGLQQHRPSEWPVVHPIPSTEYPTPARRPLNSQLDCSALERDGRFLLPSWQTALAQCLSNWPANA